MSSSIIVVLPSSVVYANRDVQACTLDVRRVQSLAGRVRGHQRDGVNAAHATDAKAQRQGVLCRVEGMTDSMIRVNRPLNSHHELRETFYRLFDRFEVVPASLSDDYWTLVRK